MFTSKLIKRWKTRWSHKSPAVRRNSLGVEALEDRLIPSATQVFAGLEFMTGGTFTTAGKVVSATGPVQVGVSPTKGATFTPLLQLDNGVQFATGDPTGTFTTTGTVSALAGGQTLQLLDAHKHTFTAPGLLGSTFFALPATDTNQPDLPFNGGKVSVTGLRLGAAELDVQGSESLPKLNALTIPITGNDFLALNGSGVSLIGPDTLQTLPTTFTLGGLQLTTQNLHPHLNLANNEFDLSGSASATVAGQTLGVTFGTDAAPGLVIVNGDVQSLTASLTSDLHIAGLTFKTEDLGVHYAASDPNVTITGKASLAVAGQTVEVALGAADASGALHSGVVIDKSSGQLVSLDAAVSTDLTIGNVEFKADGLGVHYAPADPNVTITGNASFDLKTPGGKTTDQTVSLALGDATHPGIVIDKTNGQLVSLSAAISTDLTFGGLEIKADNLGVLYQSSGNNFVISGGASFTLADHTVSLTLGGGVSPGLVISNGQLSSLQASVTGEVDLLGIQLEAKNLTVAYVAPTPTTPEEFELFGGVSVHSKFVNFDTTLGDENNPGITVVGGQLQTLNVSVDGGFSLFGINVAADGLTIQYSNSTHLLELSGGLMLELTSSVKVAASLTQGGLIIDTTTGALSIDASNGLEIKADAQFGPVGIHNLDIAFSNGAGGINFHASGEVDLPGNIKIALTKLDIQNGALADIGVAVNAPIPVGDTGFFINSLSGELDNLNNPSQIEVKASAEVSFGEEISVPTIPGIIQGGNYALIAASGTIDITPTDLTMSCTVSLVGGLLGDGQASIDLNWGSGVYTVAVQHIGIYDDTVNFSGSFQIDNQGDITLQAGATLNVPKDIPFIGGTQLAGGNLYLQVRPHAADPATASYFAGWTSVGIPGLFSENVGFKIDFAGDFSIIGGDQIAMLGDCVPAQPAPTVYTYAQTFLLPTTNATTYQFSAGSPLWQTTSSQASNINYPTTYTYETLTAPTAGYVGRTPTGRYVTYYTLSHPNAILENLYLNNFIVKGVNVGSAYFTNDGAFHFSDSGQAPYLPRPTGATVSASGLVTVYWTADPTASYDPELLPVATSVTASYSSANAWFEVHDSAGNLVQRVYIDPVANDGSAAAALTVTGSPSYRVFNIAAGAFTNSGDGTFTVELVTNTPLSQAQQPQFSGRTLFTAPTVAFAAGSPSLTSDGALTGTLTAQSFAPDAATNTTVSLFYSTKSDGSSGSLIGTYCYSRDFTPPAPGQSGPSTMKFTWDGFQNLKPGTYYVFAVIDDGHDPIQMTAVAGPFTAVSPTPTLSGPAFVALTQTGKTLAPVTFSSTAGNALGVTTPFAMPVTVEVKLSGGGALVNGQGLHTTDFAPPTFASAAAATAALNGLQFVPDATFNGVATLTFTATTNVNGVLYTATQTIALLTPNTHLVVAQSVDSTSPTDPDTVVLTVQVSNPGGPDGQDGTNVQVQNYLSPSLTVLSSTASVGTFNAATGLWTVGNLPMTGANTATLTLTLKAAPGTADTLLTNMAQGSSALFNYPATDAESVVSLLPRSHALVFTTAATLPTAADGSPYEFGFHADAGGGGPYTYTLSAGSLPPGMFLTPDGFLLGVPKGAGGTYSFSVTAANSSGAKATQAVQITVANLPLAVVGKAFSYSVTDGTGFNYYTLSGTLPAGLRFTGGFNVATFSGTPQAAGTSTVTVNEFNATTGALIAKKTETLFVDAAIVPGAVTLPAAAAGSTYSVPLPVTGGSGEFFDGVYSGSLPAGLNVSTDGVLRGTVDPNAAPGAYSFTAYFDDTPGQFVTETLTLQVNPALSLEPSALPPATVGASYSQALSATGGSGGGYTFAVTKGSLPPGLTLSTGGLLSGTIPAGTLATTTTFDVTVTDGSGSALTETFTLVANTSVTIGPSLLPVAEAGAAYTTTLTASGGSGSGYTYAVTGGRLPAGLVLSANGTLSGTVAPTAPAGFDTFTVTATDSAGSTGSITYDLLVDAALSASTASLPAANVGTAYSQKLTATGGTGIYKFAITQGSLPAGLTLSTAGVISGTIPHTTRAGTYTFAVTVSDSVGMACPCAYTLTVVPATVTWTGTVSGAWGAAGNWSSQTVPGAGDSVVIPSKVATGRMPSLGAAAVVDNLFVQAGDSLTLAGQSLAVLGTLTNQGTITLQGNEAVSLANGNDTTEGTWQFVGDGSGGVLKLPDFGAADYFNLTIADAHARRDTFQTVAELVVKGNLSISGGTLTASGGNVTTGGLTLSSPGVLNAPATLTDVGNWTLLGGTFNANHGTVVLAGSNQQVSGNTTFYNLTKIATAADTLTFQAGSTQTVGGTLTLQGAGSGTSLLKLRSSRTGTAWGLNPLGTTVVSLVDVQDGVVQGKAPITAKGSHNSGHDTGWTFA